MTSVRITCEERYAGERVPITRKAWRDRVHADPELKSDGEDSVRWSGLAADEFCLLVWRDGEIEAVDPPPALVKKMAALAIELGAVAQGALGETYNAKGEASAPNPGAVLARAKELAQRERPPQPRRLDPVAWQFVAWGFAAVVLVFAAIAMFIVTRR